MTHTHTGADGANGTANSIRVEAMMMPETPPLPASTMRAVGANTKTEFVSLAKLVVSKFNVRKHGTKDVASLAASIAAKGLLQPLLVRPAGSEFEVVFGGRRTLALRKLNASGHPDTDFVPCIVADIDDATAIAASLAENIERLPMDEMDQYEAFSGLAREGKTEVEIAAHFGITEQVVKRRLALARLIPEVRKLYRQGELDVGALQVLTLAPKERQRAYVAALQDPNGNPPPSWQLKRWLLGGAEIATTTALFPVEDYKAGIASDLFGEGSYFLDAAEFWTRQNAAIAALKTELEEHGWNVEVVDPSGHFQPWQYEKRSKDYGGRAIIVVKADGEVATRKGLIHKDDLRALEKAKRRQVDAGAESEAAAADASAPGRPELSEPLANYVELVRHACVRAALADAPKVALRVAVAQLIAGSQNWRVRPERGNPMGASIAAAVTALPASRVFDELREAAVRSLGKKARTEDPDGCLVLHDVGCRRALEVYARLSKMNDAQVMALLAVVVAETLAVGTAMVDTLGAELAVDVLNGWKPDASLLSLTRDKDALSGMLAEVVGQTDANVLLTATGAKKREAITNALADPARPDAATWKPRWLAFPQAQYTERPLTARKKLAA